MGFMPYMGSKRRLVPQLLAAVPPEFGTYFEPFLGSGALLYALKPGRAVVGDRVGPLVRTHEAVHRDWAGVMRDYRALAKTKRQSFFDIRARFPDISPAEFLFLIQNCHGNRFRTNKAGRFNTPFKENSAPTVSAAFQDQVARNLAAASTGLHGSDVRFEVCSALDLLPSACPGDFVYLDPPYQLQANREHDYGEAFGTKGWADLMEALSRLPPGVHIMVTLSGAIPRPDVLQLASPVPGLHHLAALQYPGTHIQKGGSHPQQDWLLTNYTNPC